MLLGISGITAALLADRRMRRCRFPTRCHYVHLEGAWLSPKPAIPRAANTPYGAAPPARAARMPAVAKHRPQDSNMAQLDQIVDPSDGPLSSGQRSPGNDSDRQKSAMRGRRKRAIGAPRTRARSALLRVAATNPSSRTRTVHRVFNSPTALELSTTSKTDPARSAGTSRIARGRPRTVISSSAICRRGRHSWSVGFGRTRNPPTMLHLVRHVRQREDVAPPWATFASGVHGSFGPRPHRPLSPIPGSLLAHP
jgi:hypothetical protein